MTLEHKNSFKVVQMKVLAMHIIYQKLSFNIFMVVNYKISSCNMVFALINFWYKIKINRFDPYNVVLAIATNIPQRLKR